MCPNIGMLSQELRVANIGRPIDITRMHEIVAAVRVVSAEERRIVGRLGYVVRRSILCHAIRAQHGSADVCVLLLSTFDSNS